jgi:hypothetical protein
MEPTDLDVLRRRARRMYELGRWRRALVAAVPAAALSSIAARSTHEVLDPMAGGSLLAIASVVFLWRGQHAGRAVLPGMVAGLIPFTAALLVRCAGETRFAICAVVSFLASAVGGLLVARSARVSGAIGRTWLYAGSVAILTGSVACTCIGVGGLAGLVLGLASVGAPSLLSRAYTR